MDNTQSGLTVLLESLRDEIDHWHLDPNEDGTSNESSIRYGLYLIALDILLCETRASGGYQDYEGLPQRAKLPREDYEMIKKQIDPYIKWLDGLNVSRLISLKRSGLTEAQALTEIGLMDRPVVEDWLNAISTLAIP